MARKPSYGEDVIWTAGDIAAFRIFHQLTGDQAKRVFAWDAADVSGCAVGRRPIIIPARSIADTARGLAAANA